MYKAAHHRLAYFCLVFPGTAYSVALAAQSPLPTPQILVSCTSNKLGTAGATIRWSTARVPLIATELQVTVYQDGFTRDTYARFFVANARSTPLYTEASPVRDRVLPAYQLFVTRLQSRADLALFHVDGLEDGINYYWRLLPAKLPGHSTSAVVRIDAPNCPGRGRPDRQ